MILAGLRLPFALIRRCSRVMHEHQSYLRAIPKVSKFTSTQIRPMLDMSADDTALQRYEKDRINKSNI